MGRRLCRPLRPDRSRLQDAEAHRASQRASPGEADPEERVMRVTNTMVVLALLAVAVVAPAARAQNGHGIDLGYRDTTCSPCRDFFQYANGAWLDRTPIPAAYSRYGVDREIEDRGTAALHKLLDEAAADVRTPKGGNRWKLGTFYGTCMDSDRAEREGWKPLAPVLGEIEA